LDKFVDKYFSILKDYFGDAFKIAAKYRFNWEKYYPKLIGVYDDVLKIPMLDSLFDELIELDWKSQEKLIRNKSGLKSVYTGSELATFKPIDSTSDFLRKTCLYADTIILHDQVLQNSILMRLGKNMLFSDFDITMQAAIEFLGLEDLCISDDEAPICHIAPPINWIIEKNKLIESTWKLMNKSVITCANELFSKNFSTIEEVRKFLSEVKNPEQFLNLIGTKTDFIHDGKYVSRKNFYETYERVEQKLGYYFEPCKAYEAAINDHYSSRVKNLVCAGRLDSMPITNFSGVWNSINWLIKHDNLSIFENMKKKNFSKETMIINALQQKDLKWLGEVPINKIKLLRERGELADLRDLLSRNIENVENISDEEFFEVGQQVKYNVEQAMKKHSADIQDLNEKYRLKYQLGSVSTIVSGTMGFVSAIYPPLAIAAGVASAIAGSGSIFTTKDFLEKREKIKDLKRKPVAMLFDAKNAN